MEKDKDKDKSIHIDIAYINHEQTHFQPQSTENQPTVEIIGIKKNKSFKFLFYQQILPAWRPIPTIKSSFVIFLVVGILCIVVGSVLLSYSQQIQTIEIQYDHQCQQIGKECVLKFELLKEIKQPIYVFYSLTNFYQNHRRYVKSKNLDQLNGKVVNQNDLIEDCEPAVYNKDLGFNVSYSGYPLQPSQIAVPCGLIAKSYFNDTFQIFHKNQNTRQQIAINEKGISWPKDKETKYKRTTNSEKEAWVDVENEHFIVWMRVSAFNTFKKLWGKVEQDMKPGDYELKVTNNYDMRQFQGKKHMVLQELNDFGGQNIGLAICYLIMGILCIVVSVLFFIGKQGYCQSMKEKDL